MRSSCASSSPAPLVKREPRVEIGEWGALTEFLGGVCVRVLPGVQIVQSATEKYAKEREERVLLRREDRVELEERIEVEDRRVG